MLFKLSYWSTQWFSASTWSSPSTINILIVLGEPCFFGENCRKIGVNTSGPETIKWWHHQCVSHKVMTSPMSIQSESSICWGAFPTSWIFIKNPLVTSSLFAFQIKYFYSPRLFHTALSNSKARQVRSLMVLDNDEVDCWLVCFILTKFVYPIGQLSRFRLPPNHRQAWSMINLRASNCSMLSTLAQHEIPCWGLFCSISNSRFIRAKRCILFWCRSDLAATPFWWRNTHKIVTFITSTCQRYEGLMCDFARIDDSAWRAL